MNDYKSNTDKERLSMEQKELKHKEIKPVIKGETKLHKKSFLNKMVRAFVSEDIENIPSVIFYDVVVPAVKKTAYEIITDSSYRILNDDSGTLRRSLSQTRYGGYFRSDTERPRSVSKNSRNDVNFRDYKGGTQQYDSVAFGNRPDAEMVLEAMLEAISIYDSVSIADYYELADIPNDNYTLNNYGWTDLSSAKIIQVKNGYMIKLPKAIQLRQGR